MTDILRNALRAAAVVAAVSTFTAGALAQSPGGGYGRHMQGMPGGGPMMGACADDMATLCPDVAHGSGGMPACLEQQKDKLSAACREALESHGAGMRGGTGGWGGRGLNRSPMGPGHTMQNCQPEIQKFCADVPHGTGGVPACLEEHRNDLSDACKEALENRGPIR